MNNRYYDEELKFDRDFYNRFNGKDKKNCFIDLENEEEWEPNNDFKFEDEDEDDYFRFEEEKSEFAPTVMIDSDGYEKLQEILDLIYAATGEIDCVADSKDIKRTLFRAAKLICEFEKDLIYEAFLDSYYDIKEEDENA